MNKFAKFLLVLILLLVLALAAMILVPRYFMGIDIFDLSGWFHTDSGALQYRDYRGKPLTGWQTIDDNWYYFSPKDGSMTTGWTEVDGKRYFLNEAGMRRSGWLNLADGSYYVDPDTHFVVSGWLEKNGDTYYVSGNGKICTGLTEVDGKRYFLGTDGKRTSGWAEDAGKHYFLDEEGVITTGWVDTDLGRAYLNESGVAQTGWLEQDGKRYYAHETGILAIGKVVIGEDAWYFDSRGNWVPFVNKWNPLSESYEVELVSYGSHEIAADAHDDLVAMIDQIKGLGYYKVTSIYRSKKIQQNIWDRYYNNYISAGYKKAEAERLTGQTVAVPGTSEHHLAYAVDIDGVPAVHGWLAEHSWEYGFIVRYPDGTTDITGIEYEPWHFRYVGKELAKELYELGITLEEYMDMLTEKAGNGTGTASNPEKFE